MKRAKRLASLKKLKSEPSKFNVRWLLGGAGVMLVLGCVLACSSTFPGENHRRLVHDFRKGDLVLISQTDRSPDGCIAKIGKGFSSIWSSLRKKNPIKLNHIDRLAIVQDGASKNFKTPKYEVILLGDPDKKVRKINTLDFKLTPIPQVLYNGTLWEVLNCNFDASESAHIAYNVQKNIDLFEFSKYLILAVSKEYECPERGCKTNTDPQDDTLNPVACKAKDCDEGTLFESGWTKHTIAQVEGQVHACKCSLGQDYYSKDKQIPQSTEKEKGLCSLSKCNQMIPKKGKDGLVVKGKDGLMVYQLQGTGRITASSMLLSEISKSKNMSRFTMKRVRFLLEQHKKADVFYKHEALPPGWIKCVYPDGEHAGRTLYIKGKHHTFEKPNGDITYQWTKPPLSKDDCSKCKGTRIVGEAICPIKSCSQILQPRMHKAENSKVAWATLSLNDIKYDGFATYDAGADGTTLDIANGQTVIFPLPRKWETCTGKVRSKSGNTEPTTGVMHAILAPTGTQNDEFKKTVFLAGTAQYSMEKMNTCTVWCPENCTLEEDEKKMEFCPKCDAKKALLSGWKEATANDGERKFYYRSEELRRQSQLDTETKIPPGWKSAKASDGETFYFLAKEEEELEDGTIPKPPECTNDGELLEGIPKSATWTKPYNPTEPGRDQNLKQTTWNRPAKKPVKLLSKITGAIRSKDWVCDVSHTKDGKTRTFFPELIDFKLCK